MTTISLLTSLSLLPPASAGERWFYPNTTPERVWLDDPARLTGAVLVGLAPGADLPEHPDVTSAEWLTRSPAVVKLTLRPGSDDVAVSLALRAATAGGGVRWAAPDLRVEWVPHDLPADPWVASQWHLENSGQGGWTPGVDIDAEGAWALSTGAGITIAVLDSGTDPSHPDLNVTMGWDYIANTSDYTSQDMSHGTAAAGVAAAIGNNDQGVAGVAYDAHIYASRMVGGSISQSATYNAFVDAVDAGAAVISNSWGYASACDGYAIWGTLEDALEYAETQGRGGLGTVVVQAAGNDNCDISGDGLLAVPTVVGVAAISGHDEKEWYSSYGDHIDISAPSGGLLTTDVVGGGGYGSYDGDDRYWDGFSGTSAATPVVSGVFALMFAANPRLTAADAREVICDTATRNDIAQAQLNTDGWSPLYGCGRVDAAAAVAAVADGPPEAPRPLQPSAEEDTILYEDRVWLDWEAALDPDNDTLRYEVAWWLASDTDTDTVEDVGSSLSLELTGAVVAGDVLSWKVRAVDLWGPGPWSDTLSLEIQARPLADLPPPEAPGGCATLSLAPAPQGSAGMVLGMLGVLAGRRRRQRNSREKADSRLQVG